MKALLLHICIQTFLAVEATKTRLTVVVDIWIVTRLYKHFYVYTQMFLMKSRKRGHTMLNKTVFAGVARNTKKKINNVQ